MLSIGINLVTTDFNRKDVLVYHICDDVTGKVLPVCGADIELSDNGDATSLIEEIRTGVVPPLPDSQWDEGAARRVCGRCQKVCLSPEPEEKKSERRLTRRRRREANAKLVESYKQSILKEHLSRCPKCGDAITIKEPLGYLDGSADCGGCGLRWDFSILAEPNGRVIIWADDDTEQHKGTAKGQIPLDGVTWEWR
jgi:hypothetical protein